MGKLITSGLIVFFLSLPQFIEAQDTALPSRPKAPDFKLKSLEGESLSLSDFKGKVVMMDLWASWCGPCIREMPASKALQDSLRGEGVVFLYISVDKDKEAWKRSAEKIDIDGVHLISINGSQGALLRNYGKGSIPLYCLIDKEGRLADRDAARPSQPKLLKDIRSLLNEETTVLAEDQ